MSTHNLCFEQKYEKYRIFLSEIFIFSVYLNRQVFVMIQINGSVYKRFGACDVPIPDHHDDDLVFSVPFNII